MRFRIFGFLSLLNVAWAAEERALDIRTTGYFMWNLGYVNEMQDLQARTFKNEIIGGFLGGLRLSANPSERMYLVVNPEVQGEYMLPRRPGIAQGEGDQKIQWNTFIQEAKTIYSMGDLENPFLRIGMGMMEYKDNPHGRIFGDYIFRSMIYPSIITTSVNYPKANIFGLHLQNNLGPNFKHNLFVLGETDHYPFFDFSLAYTADYTLGRILNVGAGVNLRSILPIRPSLTTPKVTRGDGTFDNTFKWIPLLPNPVEINTTDAQGNAVKKFVKIVQVGDSAQVFVDADPSAGATPKNTVAIKYKDGAAGIGGLIGGGIGNPTGQINNPAMVEMTPEDGIGELYPELVAVGGYNQPYSFGGTLFMGRIAVSPLGFMEFNPLGENALTLYAEAAVLGWKNYLGYYENRSERIPIMVGISLPNFNKVDFVNFEIEYFPSKLIPTYEYRFKRNVPQALVEKAGLLEQEWADPDRQKKDDLKWGLAAKKSFRGIQYVVQGGTDHSRWLDDGHHRFIDNLTRPSHWYMQLRVIGGVY